MTVTSIAQALVQCPSWLQLSVAASPSPASTSTATAAGGAAAADSDAAPTSTADSSGSSSGSSAAPAATAAPPSTVVSLQHVVVNVTSVTYQYLAVRRAAATSPSDSADTTAASASSAGSTDSTTGAVAASAATSSDTTSPSIVRLGADDFTQLRARSVDGGNQTALSLDLTTRDGDTIRLDFRQIDTFSRTWAKGETNDGSRVRTSSTTASSQRYVSMAVNGNLSDDEKAAIDAVLQNVVDVANQFFHGDLRAAVAHLSDMNVDTKQLAEVSLKMSMGRNRQLSQVAIGGDAARMQQAAQANSGVSRTLEYLADQQKQLIVAAKTQFDDRSAVQVVRQLLPALIAPSSAAPTAPSSVDRSAGVATSDVAPAGAAAATSADSSAATDEAQTDSAAPAVVATA